MRLRYRYASKRTPERQQHIRFIQACFIIIMLMCAGRSCGIVRKVAEYRCMKPATSRVACTRTTENLHAMQKLGCLNVLYRLS